MLSIAFIGVMLVSCDSENENDFIVEDKIEGLRFLIPADPPAIEIDADVDDFEIISPSSRPEASNSRNVYCTEYIRITDLLFTQSFCTPTTSAQRCQYLNGFYSLAALFYEYDCVPEVFCANCESYAAFGEEFLAWTIANGINPSGIQDMIDRIAENCENCPSEDPCEEECEGVDVTVGYEEIEINGKPCCRVTWTLVDPNGCTDGTIIAGTGSNGPFIPTIFNTNNSGILSASHCDVETSEYWIQTGGECPQVFGPFSLDCDSQDPCEDECEGVDIDVKEEIVIGFDNRECCRLNRTS